MASQEMAVLSHTQLQKSYKSNKGHRNRLFLFDYDGTLTPIVQDPDEAILTDKMLDSILNLGRNLNNVVWIVSGRDREFLDSIFGQHMGIGLCAEHGAYSKPPREHEWTSRAQNVSMNWQEKVVEVMQKYSDEMPGAVIERKHATITWHYRNAEALDLTTVDACYDDLTTLVEDLGKGEEAVALKLMKGKMILEVKPAGINKGLIARELIDKEEPGFVLTAGDDTTDEDMFREVGNNEHCWSLYVGTSNASSPSAANFRVNDPIALGRILSAMALLE